jgi:hypothetical protein
MCTGEQQGSIRICGMIDWGGDLDRDLPEGPKAQQIKITGVPDSKLKRFCFRTTGGGLDKEEEE